jgi:hypothetical protein
MTEWRVHIVPKIQPRDRTFVLMPGEKVMDYGNGIYVQTVGIDWYGKDMAAAKWVLRLVSGDSFQPPGPPPRDSMFELIHEATGRYMSIPSPLRGWEPGKGWEIFTDWIPDWVWDRGRDKARMGPLTICNRTDAGNNIRFDPLTAPYLAINDEDRKRVFDVAGSRTDPNTPVLCWEWNGGDNQQWKLEFVN